MPRTRRSDPVGPDMVPAGEYVLVRADALRDFLSSVSMALRLAHIAETVDPFAPLAPYAKALRLLADMRSRAPADRATAYRQEG